MPVQASQKFDGRISDPGEGLAAAIHGLARQGAAQMAGINGEAQGAKQRGTQTACQAPDQGTMGGPNKRGTAGQTELYRGGV